jgi:hypothetical protein
LFDDISSKDGKKPNDQIENLPNLTIIDWVTLNFLKISSTRSIDDKRLLLSLLSFFQTVFGNSSKKYLI